ncbi:hypothetical protein GP486_008081, partial [Trichoglossum hirsutum]
PPNTTTVIRESVRAFVMTDHIQEHHKEDCKQQDYKQEYIDFLEARQRQLKIVKTTTSPCGQVLDWIRIESQGETRTPPPSPKRHQPDRERPEKLAVTELQLPGAERGPQGTVPLLRPSFKNADFKIPLKDFIVKRGPPLLDSAHKKSGLIPLDATIPPLPHWYVSSLETVDNYGCQGQFSCFAPSVDKTADFSLIQLGAICRDGAWRSDRPDGIDNRQTLEAGLQRYPSLYGDNNVHVFTYFTTVGYNPVEADNVGGYNRRHQGWHQYDKEVFPGCAFTPTSVNGGDQYKIWLVYQLWRGDWWFWCQDRWLGYYPGSLFVSNPSLSATAGASATAADHCDIVGFWGEVYDSADTPLAAEPTTTDMGSGEFAQKRWRHSAYIHNALYQASPSKEPDGVDNSDKDYNGESNVYVSDPARYSLEDHPTGGGNWGSYMWLGGPGYVPPP